MRYRTNLENVEQYLCPHLDSQSIAIVMNYLPRIPTLSHRHIELCELAMSFHSLQRDSSIGRE